MEATFRRFAPFLRQVVSRQMPPGLRSKFDSEDIVQSVWRTLLQNFRKGGRQFADAEHLRAFLIHVTRNRLKDRVRQQAPSAARERSLAELDSVQLPTADEPRPSQRAQRRELWEQILALCPPERRELVKLKRDGFSLDEIAAQTGL